MPGPNYTREFGYNEEAQLLSISHSGTLAYQYAYGADGNRRWAKDIANNAWTWYPCGVACGAGELVEQGSDLTGATWTTNAQYLRAGGGCSSMLIRRKSATDDEYHHEDPLGAFGVITGANGAVLSSNVYDAFMGMQYVQGVSKTTQPATCYIAMSEPSILTGSGGRGVVVPSRGFQVMGKKPAPAKKHRCGKKAHIHRQFHWLVPIAVISCAWKLIGQVMPACWNAIDAVGQECENCVIGLIVAIASGQEELDPIAISLCNDVCG